MLETGQMQGGEGGAQFQWFVAVTAERRDDQALVARRVVERLP